MDLAFLSKVIYINVFIYGDIGFYAMRGEKLRFGRY